MAKKTEEVNPIVRTQSKIGEAFPAEFLIDLAQSGMEAVVTQLRRVDDLPEEVAELADSVSVLFNMAYYRMTDQIENPEKDYWSVPEAVASAVSSLYKLNERIESWS